MKKTIEYAIEVNHLYLRYPLFSKMSFQEIISQKTFGIKKRKYFEALTDISFQVEKGDIVGIIGKNGSGKSTLLSTLAGIFSPDSGTIDIHGHSISLLSIGTGFNTEMSGRENIYLSGMLLGYSRDQINLLIDDIIEFSDIGDFIDLPVKKYSSGMYSKLAFSIAITLKTDIMLVDEVLSVGDESFKQKSFMKMQELIHEEDRTVLIVSHSLSTLSQLCDKLIWLHQGKIVKAGSTQEILEEYKAFMNKK